MIKYLPHIIELRTRLIKCIFAILIILLILLPFMQDLYSFIAKPLLAQLPKNSKIIATQVASTFTVPMKLSIITALLLALPYIFYQAWSFVKPGLYSKEKSSTSALVLCSLLLFYTGILFAYLIICPAALAFFVHFAPRNVTVMTDVANYLSFMTTLLLATGTAFQIPIITITLINNNIITKQFLKKQRPYVIVGSFILGMLLTPPDVISQIMLAIPIWLLFEVGLIFAKNKSA